MYGIDNWCIELIVNAFRFCYVTESMYLVQGIKKQNTKKIVFAFVYLCGFIGLERQNLQSYILQCLYTFIVLLLIGIRNKGTKKDTLAQVSVFLLEYEGINLVGSILSILMTALFCNGMFEVQGSTKLCIVSIKTLVVLGIIYIINKKKRVMNITKQKAFWFFYIYVLVVCIKIPFLYTDIKDDITAKMMILTIICCTVIFLIISKIEKHNAAKEMARIEENNKILSTKLHKSREILPAMVQVLSNVTENNGVEMEQQEAHKLLQEVNDLYGQQLKENNKEDLQLKSFCSTGLKVLDQQLSIYQREAIDKNINFDIYVQAPINELLKRDDIDQLKLQRAVGDLVRNAFRSVEREDKKCHAKGQVLLIIGCRCEEILEVNVVDNGAEFPLYVLEAFGKRGITTGGTGNGLADLVEFAKEIKASICLDEFEGRASSFTKKISVIFDNQGINYFNSARKELVTAPFWNTI